MSVVSRVAQRSNGAPAIASSVPEDESDDTSHRLRILVDEARSAFNAAFPAAQWPAMSFDAPRWVFQRVGHQKRGQVSFTTAATRGAAGTPLPEELTLAVKASFALRSVSPQVANTLIDGVRHLWTYLQERHAWTEFFSWGALRPVMLEDFAGFMRDQRSLTNGEPLKPNTRAIRETELNTFLAWLAGYGIVAKNCQVSRSAFQQAFVGVRRVDSSVERRARFPDRKALETLAELFQTPGEPWDRLMLALCGIMLITGLRESEVRDLPLDCLERVAGPDGERVRFKYWNRKPAGSTYFYAQRWLSPMAAELAKRLVDEVRTLTGQARKLAELKEANADGLFAPADDRQMLSPSEAARALGYLDVRSMRHSLLSAARSPLHPYSQLRSVAWEGKAPPKEKASSRHPRQGYTVSDVKVALQRRQALFPLIAYTSPEGQTQMLSETLFCVSDEPEQLQRPVAVRKLERGNIASFIAGPRSIFARRFPDDERRDYGLRTHAFRHFLNTLANKAGMSVFLITVWMQRRNEEHTNAYLWEAPDLADIARHDVADQRMVGVIADRAAALPPEERREFLERTIELAHVAPGGMVCTKDFATETCGRQQNCAGCGYLLAEKGNAKHSKFLQAKAVEAQDVGGYYEELEKRGVRVVERQRALVVEVARAASRIADEVEGGNG